MVATMDAPVPFDGTREQADANRDTHWFIDGRCADCDCRPFGRCAEYPCGVEPPRQDEPDNNYLGVAFVAHAMNGGAA